MQTTKPFVNTNCDLVRRHKSHFAHKFAHLLDRQIMSLGGRKRRNSNSHEPLSGQVQGSTCHTISNRIHLSDQSLTQLTILHLCGLMPDDPDHNTCYFFASTKLCVPITWSPQSALNCVLDNNNTTTNWPTTRFRALWMKQRQCTINNYDDERLLLGCPDLTFVLLPNVCFIELNRLHT